MWVMRMEESTMELDEKVDALAERESEKVGRCRPFITISFFFWDKEEEQFLGSWGHEAQTSRQKSNLMSNIDEHCPAASDSTAI
jgi:hypothetical protein